jgi:hypothetical protein
LCGEAPPERPRDDVVRERPLAVDLDHGKPLAVPPLEGGIAADVNLGVRDAELLADGANRRERPLAEVTPLCVEDDDAGAYG